MHPVAAGGLRQWVRGGDCQLMQIPRGLLRMHVRRHRRRLMGVKVGGDEAQEEADEIARYEDEGDAGDEPHVSPARSQWFDVDIIGSSSMMQPMHASMPAGDGGAHPFPPVDSPDPFFHATLDAGTLDDVFDMIRAPDTVVMSQAVSYRTSRDHRLDPSSSAFVASPHQPHGMGYTAETAAQEPSPPPPPQRPTRTVRPPPCGTGGHLHHGSGYM
ncbi:hypothetical protein PIB30_027050 [Stylosanthes scabra]|uniref:Uncharacterized protein n=1 Tax=Stylosanthes scabra TaxID=79078 RepID=A0ABU6SAS4_9FABA|nr:hypothetical protein [Stylosanthes scabra]